MASGLRFLLATGARMKSKLIYPMVALAVLATACGGRSSARNAAQQQYETVQEGSAAGVTSTIHGPGETLPPITGTNADTTTAFTLNPAALPPNTAPQVGTGTTPPPMMSSAPPSSAPAAPARRPVTQPSQQAQPAPAQPVEPQPTEPPPTDTANTTAPSTDTSTTTQPPAAEKPKEEPPPPPSTDTSATQQEEEEPPPPPPPFGVR